MENEMTENTMIVENLSSESEIIVPDIVVNSAVDVADDDTWTGFGEALAAAKASGEAKTIGFADDLFGAETKIATITGFSAGSLEKDKNYNITVDAGEDRLVVFDGNNVDARFVTVGASNTLTLKNVVIDKYSDNGDGGAINNSGICYINGSTFSNISGGAAAGVSGGVIYNEGTLQVDNTLFIDNKALTDKNTEGGNIAIVGASAVATFTGCTFTNQAFSTSYGRGSVFFLNNGKLNIAGCTFNENQKGTGSHAIIYNKNNAAGQINVSGRVDDEDKLHYTVFDGNVGCISGLSLYAYIENTIFKNTKTIVAVNATENSAYTAKVRISGATFSNNANGAIYLKGGSINLSNVKFLTDKDTVTLGTTTCSNQIDFQNAIELNASLTGDGVKNATDAQFTFNNTAEINIAGLTFSGTDNSMTFNGSQVVNFTDAAILNEGAEITVSVNAVGEIATGSLDWLDGKTVTVNGYEFVVNDDIKASGNGQVISQVTYSDSSFIVDYFFDTVYAGYTDKVDNIQYFATIGDIKNKYADFSGATVAKAADGSTSYYNFDGFATSNTWSFDNSVSINALTTPSPEKKTNYIVNINSTEDITVNLNDACHNGDYFCFQGNAKNFTAVIDNFNSEYVDSNRRGYVYLADVVAAGDVNVTVRNSSLTRAYVGNTTASVGGSISVTFDNTDITGGYFTLGNYQKGTAESVTVKLLNGSDINGEANAELRAVGAAETFTVTGDVNIEINASSVGSHVYGTMGSAVTGDVNVRLAQATVGGTIYKENVADKVEGSMNITVGAGESTVKTVSGAGTLTFEAGASLNFTFTTDLSNVAITVSQDAFGSEGNWNIADNVQLGETQTITVGEKAYTIGQEFEFGGVKYVFSSTDNALTLVNNGAAAYDEVYVGYSGETPNFDTIADAAARLNAGGTMYVTGSVSAETVALDDRKVVFTNSTITADAITNSIPETGSSASRIYFVGENTLKSDVSGAGMIYVGQNGFSKDLSAVLNISDERNITQSYFMVDDNASLNIASGAELTFTGEPVSDNGHYCFVFAGGVLDLKGTLNVDNSSIRFSRSNVAVAAGAVLDFGGVANHVCVYKSDVTINGQFNIGAVSAMGQTLIIGHNTADFGGAANFTVSGENAQVNIAGNSPEVIIYSHTSGNGNLNVADGGKFIFAEGTVVNHGGISVSGGGLLKANTLRLEGGETVVDGGTLEVASLTINGGSLKFINGSSLDAGTVAITVDGTGLEAGTVIATGVTGTIGADDIVSNVEKGYLDIVDGNLVLKIAKDGALAEDSTGSVYGGGAANNGVGISQEISAGTKSGTVFAGSETGVDSVITTTVSGGSIQKNLYGGGKVSADTTNLTINGGNVDWDVYGGVYNPSANTHTTLQNSNLTISAGEFARYIIGGSRVQNGGTHETTGTVTLTIRGGKFAADDSFNNGHKLYAAGYLVGTGTASVSSGSEVNFDEFAGNAALKVSQSVLNLEMQPETGISGSVYGGAFASNGGIAYTASSDVTVSTGTYGYVFGGGLGSTGGISVTRETSVTIKAGASVTALIGGGASGKNSFSYTRSAEINVNGGSIGTIYLGGRYADSYVQDSTVFINNDSATIGRITGASEYDSDNVTGTAKVGITATAAVGAIDFVDIVSIAGGATLTLDEVIDFSGAEDDFVLDFAVTESVQDWEVLSSEGISNLSDAQFSMNGESLSAEWNDNTATFSNGATLTVVDGKKLCLTATIA